MGGLVDGEMSETEAVAGYWLPDQQLGEAVETVEVGSHNFTFIIILPRYNALQ